MFCGWSLIFLPWTIIGEVDGFVDVDSQSLPNVQIIEQQEMHIRKSILMVPRRYFNLDICSSTICHLIQKSDQMEKNLKNTYIASFCFPSQMHVSTTIFS
jgi:hypothetical protein